MNIIQKDITYSIGMKIYLGNYQTIDVHVGETSVVSFEKGTQQDINAQMAGEYAILKDIVDQRLIDAAAEIKKEFGVK